MSPMSAIDSLRDRIERLLEESRSRHAGPGHARRGPAATEKTRDRFDVLARLWLEDFVVPRMTMLADSFPNSKPVQCALSDRRISLRLDRQLVNIFIFAILAALFPAHRASKLDVLKAITSV